MLLRGTQPVVLCPARGIEKIRLGKDLKADIDKGKVLVLSPFEGKIKRPTAQISKRRNQFVGALSAAVFVSYAEPHGKTEELCNQVLRTNKPVYTFEDGYNKAIIERGAIPVPPEKLGEWAVSFQSGLEGRILGSVSGSK